MSCSHQDKNVNKLSFLLSDNAGNNKGDFM